MQWWKKQPQAWESTLINLATLTKLLRRFDMTKTAYTGADIHDGINIITDKSLVIDNGVVDGVYDPSKLPIDCEIQQLDGGVICPGFVDLQVNGGGGVLFNDDPSVETLKTIIDAHISVGTLAILPTLISDTQPLTVAAIKSVSSAIDQGVHGIIGIHLEGPHLSQKRKGAHDANVIRKMDNDDLNVIAEATKIISNIMLTVAPENVTNQQIKTLSELGVIVSLGHSQTTFNDAISATDSGASCVTHLFNAMSQLNNREPGLVGAALDDDRLTAGIIADGIHIHPSTLKAAMRAKQSKDGFFLVSDAMATIGSNIQEFKLNGRSIYRSNGKLTLEDGTLAGADLDLKTAVENMVSLVGASKEKAISMATSIPSSLLNDAMGFGRIQADMKSKLIYLCGDHKVRQLKS
jgi:N-acetylglucosamine-6-phosphate deacetylase